MPGSSGVGIELVPETTAPVSPRLLSSRSLTQGLFASAVVVAIATSGCSTKSPAQNNNASSGSAAPEEVGRRESVPCKSGDTTLPIDAFDINPDEATGSACNIGNVLDADGSFAALDWSGDGTHKLAGRDVTGCMAVEFSDGVTLSSLSMNMRPVGAGCGHACTEGTDGCGSGWKVSIFAGPSLAKLKFVQLLPLTTADFFEYRIAIYKDFQAKFVAICREPTPAAGDDVAIESVYGFCR